MATNKITLYIVDSQRVYRQCMTVREAKRWCVERYMDTRGRIIIKRISHKMWAYVKPFSRERVLFFGSREALIREGYSKQLRSWEETHGKEYTWPLAARDIPYGDDKNE